MHRWVILEHDHPFLHWDLMLQTGDVLRTWRLAESPQPGKTIRAEAIANHRLMYLDYEGPVSGNRGRVRRWDEGIYQGELGNGEQIVLVLNGRRFRGRLVLRRDGDHWITHWSTDETDEERTACDRL